MKNPNKRSPDYVKRFNNIEACAWVQVDRRRAERVSMMFSLRGFYKDMNGKEKMTRCYKEEEINDIYDALRWIVELRVKGC